MEHVSGQCNLAPQVIQQVVVTSFSYFELLGCIHQMHIEAE
jgi:hypothetical protein